MSFALPPTVIALEELVLGGDDQLRLEQRHGFGVDLISTDARDELGLIPASLDLPGEQPSLRESAHSRRDHAQGEGDVELLVAEGRVDALGPLVQGQGADGVLDRAGIGSCRVIRVVADGLARRRHGGRVRSRVVVAVARAAACGSDEQRARHGEHSDAVSAGHVVSWKIVEQVAERLPELR